MAKPFLLSEDDDSDVLRGSSGIFVPSTALNTRSLEATPEGALDLLNQLKVRNDSVALLLADQRMPRIDGVEFLQQATRDSPSPTLGGRIPF